MDTHTTHAATRTHEQKTLLVIFLTLLTMIAEIVFGYVSHSMALLADGYHMGTHALALGLTWLAYVLMRKYTGSALFPNGTAKIGTLTAYTSSLFLGLTGLWIVVESVQRFFHPLAIAFNEAILVATIGLVVNAACIAIMGNAHEHPSHPHPHHDYNFKAAYYHILADALTSVLAIAALVLGKYLTWTWLDACIGLLGGLLIVKWAVGLLKDTVSVLIDKQANQPR